MKLESQPAVEFGIGLAAVSGLLVCVYQIWAAVSRRLRRARELDAIRPKLDGVQVVGSGSRPGSATSWTGVRRQETIEFRVPTIKLNEVITSYREKNASSVYLSDFPTQDTTTGCSDSDYMTPGYASDRGGGTDSKRSSAYSLHRYSISAEQISKEHYADMEARQQSPRLRFVLHYNPVKEQLLVTLLGGNELARLCTRRTTLSPMVKLVLLPEKSPKYFSKTLKNSSNPIFNQLFVFPARRLGLTERRLKLTLMDDCSERSFQAKKYFLGEAIYPLTSAGLTQDVRHDFISDELDVILGPKAEPNGLAGGELKVGLSYAAADSGLLTITLERLRSGLLKDLHIAAVYCKVSVFLKRKRVKTQKSPPRRVNMARILSLNASPADDQDPDQGSVELGDCIRIQVTPESLSELELIVTAYGRQTASQSSVTGSKSKHELGKLVLGGSGSSSVESARVQWQEAVLSRASPGSGPDEDLDPAPDPNPGPSSVWHKLSSF